MSILYKMLKTAINDSYFSIEDMKDKLSVFYFFNQISKEQYEELMNIVAPTNTSTDTSTSTGSPDSTTTN